MKLRGYIFSRSFLGERVPQHVQNIVIRDYCNKNKYNYLLSATEYAMPASDLMLKQTISEFENIDGVVAYSIFQLPENSNIRFSIIKSFLDAKKELHFACEGMSIKNNDDHQKIETIWQIKLTVNLCELKGDL
ncbi:sporadic carbohydrate cluster protein, LIC12192 family [bacterium]|nr:sporadic carbohydrate cluster protein, LIC12192 family [bacterium]